MTLVLFIQSFQLCGKRMHRSCKLLQETAKESLSSKLMSVIAVYVC
jgi:hypothetical protein